MESNKNKSNRKYVHNLTKMIADLIKELDTQSKTARQHLCMLHSKHLYSTFQNSLIPFCTLTFSIVKKCVVVLVNLIKGLTFERSIYLAAVEWCGSAVALGLGTYFHISLLLDLLLVGLTV